MALPTPAAASSAKSRAAQAVTGSEGGRASGVCWRAVSRNQPPKAIRSVSTGPRDAIRVFAEAVSAGHRPMQGTYEQAREALAVVLAVNRSLGRGDGGPVG
jgi:hypothetical protein